MTCIPADALARLSMLDQLINSTQANDLNNEVSSATEFSSDETTQPIAADQ